VEVEGRVKSGGFEGERKHLKVSEIRKRRKRIDGGEMLRHEGG
jgi:hypothetical protein